MDLDCNKILLADEQIDLTIDNLRFTCERIETLVSKLSRNTELEDVILQLKKTKEKLHLEVVKYIKIKDALNKIRTLFLEMDKRVISEIDTNVKVKASSVDMSLIVDRTTFHWRMQ